eukprot:scaffold53040_cov17-Tisochrysis_lutea.AAC.1
MLKSTGRPAAGCGPEAQPGMWEEEGRGGGGVCSLCAFGAILINNLGGGVCVAFRGRESTVR